jgi:hypothetical protein
LVLIAQIKAFSITKTKIFSKTFAFSKVFSYLCNAKGISLARWGVAFGNVPCFDHPQRVFLLTIYRGFFYAYAYAKYIRREYTG